LLGRPYDLTFDWSDDRMYCSELVYKIYDRALGIKIGELQRVRNFDLTDAAVQAKMRERYGDAVPLDAPVISPAAMGQSPLLSQWRRSSVVSRKYLRNRELAGRGRAIARYAFGIIIAMLSAHDSLASEKDGCGAQMEVTPSRKALQLHLGHYVDGKDLHVVIRNTGEKSLDLVLPGDGSSSGMRTPIFKWAVVGANGPVKQTGIHVDATIDPLQPGEVVRLQSSQTREIPKWIPPIEISAAGTYQISLRYTNDPHREWASVYRPPRRILSPFPSFVDHDETEMKRVRTSAPCDLVSEPVEIVVVPEKMVRAMSTLATKEVATARGRKASRSRASDSPSPGECRDSTNGPANRRIRRRR